MIEERRFEFAASDGAEIAAYRWGAPGKARAVVQVAHGMGEHALRYKTPLKPLVDAGYVVYANDHRGHGRTAKPDQLGDFGAGGYDQVVDDMARLTRLAMQENPSAPVVLLGHSMGSFLAQGYLLEHASLLAGAALSGSAAVDQLIGLASRPGGLEAINASFEPARTPFDWLSRDNREVDAYIADPLCGFSLNPASMGSLFSQGARLADPKQLARIPKSFPLYVFAGSEDPVNDHGAWIDPLIERYRTAKVDVRVKIYQGARHEVLNETNRDEVVGDLLAWISDTIRR